MNLNRTRYVLAIISGLTLLALAALHFVNRQRERLPGPGSATYEEMTRTFYRGLASLQVGLLDDARTGFRRGTELVPGEPSAWANAGLVELRLGEFDAAEPLVRQAAALAPESSEMAFLLGRMESARGRLDESLTHLRRAVDLDSRNLRARFALAQEIERSAAPDADARAQEEFEKLLEQDPDNLLVLVERTRLAAKRGDAVSLRDSVARLEKRRATWSPVVIAQSEALRRAVEAR